MMKFYDSDLASDNPMDFHSDHEPPKDKIKDKKLLKKTDLRRFHKIIMRTGSGLPKPAKYDEVLYQIQEIPDIPEADEELIENLKKSEIIRVNLGLNDKEEWFDFAIESMKKEEIALIHIENLKYDQNKFKILDNNQYFYLRLIDWTTVIDLDANFNYMKKIIQKGKGLDRCDLCDEVSFSYKIMFEKNVIFEKTHKIEEKLELITNKEEDSEKLDANVLKLLKTMKVEEKCICHIKLAAFEHLSKNSFILNTINNLITEKKMEKAMVFVDIEAEIYNIIKIDDLFHDLSSLKRQLQKGRSTSKPESNSLMYFDMQIRADCELIYDSWALKDSKIKSFDFPKNFEESQEEDFSFLNNELKPLCIYLDEFKLSKVLKISLKRMKKGEIAEIICNDLSLVNKGIDKEVLEKINSSPKQLKYLIKLYNFVEGKNTFTMTIDEKLDNAKRKKQIGLDLIKQSQFKRALKSFENVNSYFELGSFNKEEINLIKDWKLSCLLNTTFCQMKLKKWKELVLVADKILEFDESNCKAIYRKGLALKELLEYEKADHCINEFLKKFSSTLSEETKKELTNLKGSVENLLVAYKNKEKKIFSQMFSQKD